MSVFVFTHKQTHTHTNTHTQNTNTHTQNTHKHKYMICNLNHIELNSEYICNFVHFSSMQYTSTLLWRSGDGTCQISPFSSILFEGYLLGIFSLHCKLQNIKLILVKTLHVRILLRRMEILDLWGLRLFSQNDINNV